MIVTSSPINSSDALTNGLVSEVYEDNLINNAKEFLLKKIPLNEHPMAKDITISNNSFDENIFEDYYNKTKKRFRGRNSPLLQ